MAKSKNNRPSGPIDPGLYESILTTRLNQLLAAKGLGRASFSDLEDAEAPALLAGHLAEIIQRALESKENSAERASVVNKLIAVLDEVAPDLGAADEVIGESPKDAVLEAILREGGNAAA